MKKQLGGFTLIELAIVLVIIGLIVGGILVGQDLVRSAGVRATLAQLERYNTAANTFLNKYTCIPGDCASAVSYGLGVAGGVGDNGDGNGTIYSEPNFLSDGSALNETFNFWYHLAQANLIEGGYRGEKTASPGFYTSSGSDFTGFAPQAKLRQGVFINALTINNQFAFGDAFIVAGNVPGTPQYSISALTPLEASEMDRKVDDGLPYTGNIVINYPGPGPNLQMQPGYWPMGMHCVVLNTNSYDLVTLPNNLLCGLAYKGTW